MAVPSSPTTSPVFGLPRVLLLLYRSALLLASIGLIALFVLPVTASAATNANNRPRIMAAALLDADRDYRADRIRVTYSDSARSVPASSGSSA
jgi:hypothetical protein